MEQAVPSSAVLYAKCGSDRVMPRVYIKDRDHNQDFGLSAVVDRHPKALLFKGPHESRLRASICGRCGYAELYAEDPGGLWDAHQVALKDQSLQR